MLLALIATLVPTALGPIAPLQATPAATSDDSRLDLSRLLADPSTEQRTLARRFEELERQTGTVTVSGGIATIDLPEGWTYFQADDARFMVEEVWGNPPDDSVLGLAMPPGEASWGVIVTYSREGFVEDDGAASIDYDELFAGMQANIEQANKHRLVQGYPRIELREWAEAPHYDALAKKLYWAMRLHFEGSDSDTLNYNVRILGRRGVLVMNAVADADDLDEVAAGCKQLLARTDFTEGNRYSDFDSSMDKIAVYGIGGLITGKVLLKAGLLAKFGKLIAVGAVGLLAAVRRLFTRPKDGERPQKQSV